MGEDKIIDLSSNPEQFEFILENGFLTFILLFQLLDSKLNLENDENDEEINKLI